MRTLTLLLLAMLTITGCDKELNYDFIVENATNKTINGSFTDFNKEKHSFTVESNDIFTIYRKTAVSSAGVNEFELQNYFFDFEIKYDTIVSNINYKSNNAWTYTKKTNTYATFYLKVDSTHFR